MRPSLNASKISKNIGTQQTSVKKVGYENDILINETGALKAISELYKVLRIFTKQSLRNEQFYEFSRNKVLWNNFFFDEYYWKNFVAASLNMKPHRTGRLFYACLRHALSRLKTDFVLLPAEHVAVAPVFQTYPYPVAAQLRRLWSQQLEPCF